MKAEHIKLLESTFSRVTEGFAFMFVRPPREGEAFPRGDAPFVQASAGFSGKFKGALSLIAPEALMLALGVNSLGDEDPDQPAIEDPADALKELMNIICGEVALVIHGENTPYTLLVPQANAIKQTQWDTLLMNDQWMRYLVDTHPVLITLRVQG